MSLTFIRNDSCTGENKIHCLNSTENPFLGDIYRNDLIGGFAEITFSDFTCSPPSEIIGDTNIS